MARIRYPIDSRGHRDCVLGVSFLITAINFWPAWRKPLPGVLKPLPALQKIHALLSVDRMPEGEIRDIDKACEIAGEHAYYDSEWTHGEQYKGWLRMWFMGAAAFEDALHTCPAWVEPMRDLWQRADEAIEKASRGLSQYHPKEAQEGFAIWCAHVSPHARPELMEFLAYEN